MASSLWLGAGNYGRNDFVGNKGYGTITAPGNDPMVITVGAMKTEGTASTSDDQIATYSSKGPTMGDHIVKPDLVAPGNQMVSLKAPGSTLASESSSDVPYSYYEINATNDISADYLRLSGTSMATPVVSGAVALLLQQNPNLTPDQVKARLMKTARKEFPRVSVFTDPTTGQTFVDQSDIFTVGAGYLDTWAALQSNDLANGFAFSPMAIPSADANVYLADSSQAVWTANSGWGENGVATQSGAGTLSGAGTPSGAETLSGVEMLCGAGTLCGAEMACGAEMLCGAEMQLPATQFLAEGKSSHEYDTESNR